MFRKYHGVRVLRTPDNCKTNRIAKYSKIRVILVGEEIKLESDGDKTRSIMLPLEIVESYEVHVLC